MKIITVQKGTRIMMIQLPTKRYSVTIEPRRGVSITKNGLKSIEECMQYAEHIRKSFEKSY